MKKVLFYIFTFFLINFLAVIIKLAEGRHVPTVSEAMLIVAVVYGVIYLLAKTVKKLFNRQSKLPRS